MADDGNESNDLQRAKLLQEKETKERELALKEREIEFQRQQKEKELSLREREIEFQRQQTSWKRAGKSNNVPRAVESFESVLARRLLTRFRNRHTHTSMRCKAEAHQP